VIDTRRQDSGNEEKGHRPKFKPCKRTDPGARHRYKLKSRLWATMSQYSIIAVFAVLIALGAMGTRSYKHVWTAKYDLKVDWIAKVITQDTFEQLLGLSNFLTTTRRINGAPPGRSIYCCRRSRAGAGDSGPSGGILQLMKQ